jgi:hypothetical protein
METAANYTFTPADFTETITLSGTIDVKVNGQNPSGNVNVNLYAYLDENYNNHLANIWVNLSDNTWTMTTAAFDAETPLYFRVETYYNNLWLNRNLGEGVRAYNQNISGINLGVNFSTITLSGTIDVKVNGQTPSGNVNVYLNAYLDENCNNPLTQIYVYLLNNTYTWTMTTAAFDTETPLYFRVEVDFNGFRFDRYLGEGVKAYNQNIYGINLGVNLSAITLSGTIDVKVNGQTPSGNVNVYLNAYLDENYNNYLAQIWVNLSDSTWSITRAAFDAETPLYFRVETYYNGLRFDRYLGESVKAYNQNISGINLGPVNFSTITLSGTIDVKVNGQTPSGDVYLYAYNYNNFLDSVQVNLSDNTWTMTTAAFDAETPLYFRVEHRGLGFSEDLGEGVRAYNQNISGINLGTVQIITESVTTINYGTPKLYNTVDKTDANYVDPLWDVLGWMPVARCNSADSDYEFIYNPTTSGKAKLYWDVDGLWLYVDVITNNISTDAGYEHSGSSVELLINERVDVGEPVGTTGGDAFANGGYYRLDSNGDISGDPIAAIEAFRLHNKYKTWRTTTGYAVIFQAPWRAMGAYPLHDGKKIGLEIQINAANDYKTGRVGVLKWYNTVKNTYQNSTVLAPVTLNLNGLTLPAQKPVITAQPVGSKVALNDPVPALTVTAASLDGGALSYRWYQATSATAFEGATAVGTNSPSYTPNVSNAVVGEHFFYVKVTNTTTEGSSALNSAMARVRVCDPAVTPFDIELVKPDHEKWDATVNALVIDNNGVSFGSYSTIVEVDIPATINMTNYIMLEFDLDTYVAGTIVPIPPNSQWYNNIGFTVLDGSGFVVYHEYYGGPGYSWNFNANYGRSAIKTADYSGGQGKVMITVPNRTDAVDKVVVRSVKFIVEE